MGTPMNLFRQTPDRSLDRPYLRLCAVYRLLKAKQIGKARALELLAQKHGSKRMATLRGTVELWQHHSLKEMLP